jgi:uncharacterized OB-fold protein
MTTAVGGTGSDSEAFWADVEAGGLPLRRCRNCSRTFVLPLPSCPYCATEDPEVIQAKGAGSLYSWVVVHHAFDPAFAGDVPYVVAAVQLDEGARVYGRLQGIAFDAITPDLTVERVAPTDSKRPPLVFRPVARTPA